MSSIADLRTELASLGWNKKGSYSRGALEKKLAELRDAPSEKAPSEAVPPVSEARTPPPHKIAPLGSPDVFSAAILDASPSFEMLTESSQEATAAGTGLHLSTVPAASKSDFVPPKPVNVIEAALGLPAAPPTTPPPVYGCSEEQVREAVAPNLARGMEISFDGGCWMFRRKGRTDSGTLSQPLSTIVKCANLVCQEAVAASRLKLS